MSDTVTMVGRAIRLNRRQLDAVLTSIMLPVMLMLLFVYLFGGAINTGTKYVTYVVPGVILLCAGFGAASTAVSVCQDLKGGIVDRFRSMDIGGTAILGGQIVASLARNLLLIGFRPHADAAHWLGATGVLLLFVLAISGLAAAVGVVAGSVEAANGFTFIAMFLPYPSSAFVPIATMPGWMHGFARNQPCTPVIETIRGMLLGTPMGNAPWLALAWCTGLIAVATVLCGVLYRRRTS
jgi:ABC-2 type transport system permease protein